MSRQEYAFPARSNAMGPPCDGRKPRPEHAPGMARVETAGRSARLFDQAAAEEARARFLSFSPAARTCLGDYLR